MQPFFKLSCNALPEALQTANCIHLLHRHRYCHCRHRRYHFKLLGFSSALKNPPAGRCILVLFTAKYYNACFEGQLTKSSFKSVFKTSKTCAK